MKMNLLDMTTDELTSAIEAMGERAYRAEQLADWVYRKGVTDPSAMSNLSPKLAGHFEILTSRLAGRSDGRDGTVKLLLSLADGRQVETVMIPDARRTTACLSMQVGCAMGCSFCASAVGGLARDCTCGEMLEQVLHIQQVSSRRVTNVVFMGMGEPLANFDQTAKALRALIDPIRFGISARKITVSTIAPPGGILRLAGLDLPITLAISLHAPNDDLRGKLMPAARGTTIEQIISDARQFQRSRNREVTVEYLLLAGVNDGASYADQLANLAERFRCNVNLIRYNPVPGLPYHRPSSSAVRAFAERLAARGVNTHIRRSRGLDATAACGQLTRRAADLRDGRAVQQSP